MNEAIFKEIAELTQVLSGRAKMIQSLIGIAEKEKAAVMAKNAELFSQLVNEKESLIKDISSVETEIKRIHELASQANGSIPKDIKDKFASVVEEINQTLTRWAQMEQQNMQFAQAFKMSLEKKITSVKKNRNVAGMYSQKALRPNQSKKFDTEV